MHDFPIAVEFPVHWAELDALGHVNHARIITWMETARINLFDRIGLESVGEISLGPILANINVNYYAPIHYPAVVVSKARITKIGRTSFTMEYAVVNRDDPNTALAVGTTVIVLYDYKAQTKTEIPQALRDAINTLQGEAF